MATRRIWITTVCMLMTASAAAADESRSSLAVSAGGELRFAVQYGDGWAKPFLYPVLRPGWSSEPMRPGAYIAIREAEVTATPAGDGVGRVSATDRVGVSEVREVDGADYAKLPDRGGWVSVEDIVPERAIAVRTLAELPMPYDRKNAAVYDHPHHKGVWIAVDSVEGRNWWYETDRVRTVSVDTTSDGFVWENEWLADDEVMLRERTVWSIPAEGPIRVAIKLTNPSEDDVTFGDTKEGLLAVRVPDDFREKSGGQLVAPGGLAGEKSVWGRESASMTYTGTSRGTEFGITLIDHPENFRRSRYHARGYGLFSINPFGPKAYSKGKNPADPLTLSPGESVNLTYGFWVHGPLSPSEVETVVEQFRGE